MNVTTFVVTRRWVGATGAALCVLFGSMVPAQAEPGEPPPPPDPSIILIPGQDTAPPDQDNAVPPAGPAVIPPADPAALPPEPNAPPAGDEVPAGTDTTPAQVPPADPVAPNPDAVPDADTAPPDQDNAVPPAGPAVIPPADPAALPPEPNAPPAGDEVPAGTDTATQLEVPEVVPPPVTVQDVDPPPLAEPVSYGDPWRPRGDYRPPVPDRDRDRVRYPWNHNDGPDIVQVTKVNAQVRVVYDEWGRPVFVNLSAEVVNFYVTDGPGRPPRHISVPAGHSSRPHGHDWDWCRNQGRYAWSANVGVSGGGVQFAAGGTFGVDNTCGHHNPRRPRHDTNLVLVYVQVDVHRPPVPVHAVDCGGYIAVNNQYFVRYDRKETRPGGHVVYHPRPKDAYYADAVFSKPSSKPFPFFQAGTAAAADTGLGGGGFSIESLKPFAWWIAALAALGAVGVWQGPRIRRLFSRG